MIRLLPISLTVPALCLAACASLEKTADAPTIEADVTAMLMEWSSSLPEGRLEDFKAVYSTQPGFLWVERGLPLYRSVDELSVGVDDLVDQNAELNNTLTDIEVHALSPNAAAFNAQMTSDLRLAGFNITFDGVLTGIALKDGDTWTLYRGHLSEPPKRQDLPPEWAGQ
ncbi:MAG: hypothetical protein AAF225_03495 [Pseudomonadota bacterium]